MTRSLTRLRHADIPHAPSQRGDEPGRFDPPYRLDRPMGVGSRHGYQSDHLSPLLQDWLGRAPLSVHDLPELAVDGVTVRQQHLHVALTDQLFGATCVQDGAGVDLGGNLERNPGREVGLDGTRNDIHRWTLGGNDQVNPYRTRQLGQACNRHFHFLASRHDQVGKFINHQYNKGQELVAFLRVQLSFYKFFKVFLLKQKI